MSAARYDLVIRNGTTVTEQGTFHADLAIQDERIAAIARQIGGHGAEEIDAGGLHVFPGLIDTHVHCNQPGRTEWEGFTSGSRSLAAGGVCTFFDMPLNSNPPTTTVEGFDLKKRAAEEESILDYGLWGGLVPGNLASLEHLHRRGVIGFKAFMSDSGIPEFGFADDATLLEGMEKIAELGSVLAVHAENEAITRRLASRALNDGRTSVHDYCLSRPVISEIEAVRRASVYARITRGKLHIVHASSGEVVREVVKARRSGADITVETCPHYLALTEDDFEHLQGLAKCSPPLRSQEDVESLCQALADGAVDIVGSDHSPASPDLKIAANGNIFSAWGGISGAQTTLNVLLEEGYWRRNLPLETIARVTSANPARRFGIYPRKGAIAVGSDADVCLVDLAASFRLERSHLFYRHAQSPFLGRTFRGHVVRTILRGTTVFDGNRPAENGRGRMIRPLEAVPAEQTR